MRCSTALTSMFVFFHSWQGDVLEVSAGTGRNLPYYSLGDVKSLTLTDSSRQMLLQAKDKLGKVAQDRGSVVRFCLSDAQALCANGDAGNGLELGEAAERWWGRRKQHTDTSTVPAAAEDVQTRYGPALRTPHQFPPHSYDTVVDSFGLCSIDDPVAALKVGTGSSEPPWSLLAKECMC
jgi:methyltransferase OMS1